MGKFKQSGMTAADVHAQLKSDGLVPSETNSSYYKVDGAQIFVNKDRVNIKEKGESRYVSFVNFISEQREG